MLRSVRLFWRALDDVDGVWVLGPHLLSLAFLLVAVIAMPGSAAAFDLNGAWASDADNCAKVFVRKGGQLGAPPRPPRRPPSPVWEQARTALAVAIGLWPLTGVVLLMLGLLYVAGNYGAP